MRKIIKYLDHSIRWLYWNGCEWSETEFENPVENPDFSTVNQIIANAILEIDWIEEQKDAACIIITRSSIKVIDRNNNHQPTVQFHYHWITGDEFSKIINASSIDTAKKTFAPPSEWLWYDSHHKIHRLGGPAQKTGETHHWYVHGQRLSEWHYLSGSEITIENIVSHIMRYPNEEQSALAIAVELKLLTPAKAELISSAAQVSAGSFLAKP